MSKHKIFFIVGKTCSGKDTIVNNAIDILKNKYNIITKPVISYTDREIRDNETNGIEHYFVSKSEFDDIEKNEKLAAYTKIAKKDGSGYRYCATVSEIENSTFYIINPKGIVDFKTRCCDTFDTEVIYISTDESIRIDRAKNNRSDFDSKFFDRMEAENTEFDEFEKTCTCIYIIENNGDINDAVRQFVDYIIPKLL